MRHHCSEQDSQFQHTAARRRLHQRSIRGLSLACFNTQPPEGGCFCSRELPAEARGFNTQPPEGGCPTASAFSFA